MVNLFGPDANRLVLLDRDRIFSARQPWTMIMGRIFPNGLLLRDGDEHKEHRKIMHEAFTRPALRQYLERMNPMVESGQAAWRGERREHARRGIGLHPFVRSHQRFVQLLTGPQAGEHNRRIFVRA